MTPRIYGVCGGVLIAVLKLMQYLRSLTYAGMLFLSDDDLGKNLTAQIEFAPLLEGTLLETREIEPGASGK